MLRWSSLLKICALSCTMIALLNQGASTRAMAAVTVLHEDIYVTLHLKHKHIEDVMVELAAITGLNFHYDKSDLNLRKKITVHFVKTPIAEVLQHLSRLTGLCFTLKEQKVIVTPTCNTQPGQGQSPLVTLIRGNIPERSVGGKVYNTAGKPVAGASIWVRDSQRGAQSQEDGSFNISARPGDVLVVRSIGYNSREISIDKQEEIVVTLNEAIKGLNEFVVTALGLSKRTKELTYATQQIGDEDITRVKDGNVINSLSGKIAGMMVNRSSAGLGGSARVILRGNKSTRENQPMYIIDGVPMANYTPAQPRDIWGQASGIIGSGGRDGGDGISNINPDDIETISILKGASAAALYGSQAANGVIVITTKRGRPGKGRLEFSSDFVFESPLLMPKLQYRYGQTTVPFRDANGKPQPGSPDSWGRAVKASDHVSSFFQTGITAINSLSFSAGTDKAQTYFSYSNTNSKGVLPTNRFLRHTFNFRETLKLFDDRLTVDINATLLAQSTNNRLSSGLYYSPLTGLYNFPRGLDFNLYKREYEYFDQARNMPLQNWWNIRNSVGWTGDDDQQNPYWVLNRDIHTDSRYRGLGSMSLRYKVNDWLSVQARGSFDKSFDEYELKAYAGTQQVLAPANGRYTLEKETNTQIYGDIMVNMTHKLGANYSLSTAIGSSILDVRAHDRTLVSTNPFVKDGLSYANKFSVADILSTALDAQRSIEQKQLQAIFSNIQLGYKNALFLDLTGRNDWSSTFAYTPIRNKGYFYYSAGVAGIISDLVKLPAVVNFAKLRLSYARVGNDIAPYASKPARFMLQTVAGVTRVSFNTHNPYPGMYLKPEDNHSLEAGVEIRMFNNRLNFDLTIYKNNNYQQYMEVPAPPGSGYLTYYLNLGNIQNKGIEATLSVAPVRTKKFNWTSDINFTTNQNKVLKLSNAGIPGANADNYFILTDFAVNMYGSFVKEGGSWGDIYANKELQRNSNGKYVIGADGNLKTNTVFKKVGNPNPRFTLGWSNTFSYRNLTLNMLVDGRFGGQVMSVTQAVLDKYGTSEASAAARDNGGMILNAEDEHQQPFLGKYDARKYYATVGGRAGIGELYMYDATNIRLRELSLSYRLPINNKWIQYMQLGVTGKNLCFFKLEAPFDPEVSMSSGNGLQGIDVFGVPATRSYGISLRAGF